MTRMSHASSRICDHSFIHRHTKTTTLKCFETFSLNTNISTHTQKKRWKKVFFGSLPRKFFPPNRIKEGNILCERNPINTRVIQPQENLHRQYDCSLSLSAACRCCCCYDKTTSQENWEISSASEQQRRELSSFALLWCCLCSDTADRLHIHTTLLSADRLNCQHAREREKKLKISYSADSLFSLLEH